MEYIGPINQYLDVLERIHRTVPAQALVTRDDIVQLIQRPGFVHDLVVYNYYTFPAAFSLVEDNDFRCLRVLLQFMNNILYTIPDGSIVLAPGDSPAKIIQTLRQLYGTAPNVLEYAQDGVRVRKQVRFVQFPLSRIQIESGAKPEVINYLHTVFQQHAITEDQLLYLDHLEAGQRTKTVLTRALRRFFRNPRFLLSTLPLRDLWWPEHVFFYDENPCFELYFDLFSDSERTGSRCIKKYAPADIVPSVIPPLPFENVLRCNVVSITFYLEAANILPKFIPVQQRLPTVHPDDLALFHDLRVRAKWYDAASQETVEREVWVEMDTRTVSVEINNEKMVPMRSILTLRAS